MTDLIDHHGEIRRREHYQGMACLAAQKPAPLQIVTRGHADSSDDDILELLLSDTAVSK